MTDRFPFSGWPLGPGGYSWLSGLPLGDLLMRQALTPRMPWDVPASKPPSSSPPFGAAGGFPSSPDQPKAAGDARKLDFFGPPPRPSFFGLSSPDDAPPDPPAINPPSLLDLYVAMLPPLVARSSPNESRRLAWSPPSDPNAGLRPAPLSASQTSATDGNQSPPIAPTGSPWPQADTTMASPRWTGPSGSTPPLEHLISSQMWPVGPELHEATAHPPLGSRAGTSVAPPQDAGRLPDDPFDRAAIRTRRSARSQVREPSLTARVLDAYFKNLASGLVDTVTLPGRAPMPAPKGLEVNDAGEWLVNGQPAAETTDGRAWLEDQQRRADWGPATALMLALGRVPRMAPRGPFAPSSTPATSTAQPPGAASASGSDSLASPPLIQNRLFDYSRLHETPNVPQFDLDRYVPPRGVPQRIQGLDNPTTLQQVNTAVKRGLEQEGREFYNTEPLREAFLEERGPVAGRAAYDRYMNLNAATSPVSPLVGSYPH